MFQKITLLLLDMWGLFATHGAHAPSWCVTKDDPKLPTIKNLMHLRTRKLLGTFLLLIFLTLYAFLAMIVAIILQVNSSKAVELLYYCIAGLAWVLPAGLILQWMLKEKP